MDGKLEECPGGKPDADLRLGNVSDAGDGGLAIALLLAHPSAQACDNTRLTDLNATQTQGVDSLVSTSGSLIATVNNPSNWSLLPITTVTFRPADASGTSFATHLMITTSTGTLVDSLALNFLSIQVGITAVYVECLDGTPLLLGLDQTCSGATLTEQQTRRMKFISLPGYGLHLNASSVTIPYMTFEMTETSVLQAPGPWAHPSSNTEKSSDTGGQTWVTNMGMQW